MARFFTGPGTGREASHAPRFMRACARPVLQLFHLRWRICKAGQPGPARSWRVRGCLRSRAHYLDITGEIPVNLCVLYTRMPRLFADLAIAHGDARYARLSRSLARVKLLILDDWGPETLTPNQVRDLLEIVEDRYDKGALIITSQVPVDRWHDLIGVPTLADAILDRVIHNAYRIDLAGESLRKRRSSP